MKLAVAPLIVVSVIGSSAVHAEAAPVAAAFKTTAVQPAPRCSIAPRDYAELRGVSMQSRSMSSAPTVLPRSGIFDEVLNRHFISHHSWLSTVLSEQ